MTAMKSPVVVTVGPDVIDAKGDLIVGTAPDVPTRFPVGANGTVLTADTAQTSGMKWAPPFVINVKDYGAVGNGSTNDTTAVQNALNAGAGQIVYFPTGTYVLNNVTVPTGTVVRGAGWGQTTLKLQAGATAYILQVVADASGVIVEDLKLDGNAANAPASGACIFFLRNTGSVNHCVVRNCWFVNGNSYGVVFYLVNNTDVVEGCIFENFKDAAIVMQNATWCKIKDNHLYNCLNGFNNVAGWGGITVSFSALQVEITGNRLYNTATTLSNGNAIWLNIDTGASADIIIADNSIYNCGGVAIGVYANTKNIQTLQVTGNLCYGHQLVNTTMGGLYIVGAGGGNILDAVVSDNIVDGTVDTGYGIQVSVGFHITITGNEVYNAGDPGFLLGNLTDFTCVGNTSSNPGGAYGLSLITVDRGVISNNIATGNAYAGIAIGAEGGGPCSHLLVSNNVCMNNGALVGGPASVYAGIVLVQTTYSQVIGNFCQDPGGHQTYGVNDSSISDNNWIIENDVRGLATPIGITGANTVAFNNRGHGSTLRSLSGGQVTINGPLAITGNYGTTLPASPVDGQEAILVDSLTNPTYQWQFRYNAGSTSPYKWEFVGGTEVLITVAAAETTTTTAAWLDLATIGPRFFVPRAGDYDTFTSAQISHSVANSVMWIGASVGATAPQNGSPAANPLASTADNSGFAQDRYLGLASGAELRTRYFSVTAGTASWASRQLRVKPVRVS